MKKAKTHGHQKINSIRNPKKHWKYLTPFLITLGTILVIVLSNYLQISLLKATAFLIWAILSTISAIAVGFLMFAIVFAFAYACLSLPFEEYKKLKPWFQNLRYKIQNPQSNEIGWLDGFDGGSFLYFCGSVSFLVAIAGAIVLAINPHSPVLGIIATILVAPFLIGGCTVLFSYAVAVILFFVVSTLISIVQLFTKN